jgi:hypothetical protein
MTLTTRSRYGRGVLTLAVTALGRYRPLAAALGAAVLVIGCAGLAGSAGNAAASDGLAAELPVGHTVKRIAVPEVTPFPPEAETLRDRMVDVHLWYPADPADVPARDKAVYTSALWRRALIPTGETEPIAQWDPLEWSFQAEIAREGAAIDPHPQPFPVIVFSHGSVNDPINYAHLLERIAAAGFVVAAPSHVTDTQEDVRIDFINQQARLLVPPRARLFPWTEQREPCRSPAGTVPESGPARSRSGWPSASGTSRRSWTNCPHGSEPALTSPKQASWATRAAPSADLPPRPAAWRGTTSCPTRA